jgi:hypothetical protein
MQSRLLFATLLLGAVACGQGKEQATARDTVARDLELAPADSQVALSDTARSQPAPAPAPEPTPAAPKPAPQKPSATRPAPVAHPATSAAEPAPAPAPAGPKALSAAAGTTLSLTSNDSIHSRHDEAGKKIIRATVAQDVRDQNGRVVIPEGSIVTLRVTTLEPAKNSSAKDGEITLEATQVTIGGTAHSLSGESHTADIEHKLVGQGVTAGGAARVGGGAAAGAILGKVIGGKTGAIIGGVAGAGGGAVLAAKTADRDVVVAPGNRITLTLNADFTVVK